MQDVTVGVPIARVSGRVFTKRALEFVIALVATTIAFPLMLAAAVAIALTSRGPVLFQHERIGIGGRPFTMYKFRTMTRGTHEVVVRSENLRQVYRENGFKLPSDDPRITRIGRLLRSTSIDELPQLLNVIRGDMSLVGIRPIERAQLDQRPCRVQSVYRSMRPGITGLWQTSGRSTLSIDERDALDIEYVETWSLVNDLKILLRTPAAIARTSETG